MQSVTSTSFRLDHEKHHEDDGDEVEDRGDPEPPPPVPGGVGERGGHDVAQPRAHGDGQVEDGQDHAALLVPVEVAQHGRRDGGEAGLAEAQSRAKEQERPVALLNKCTL